MVHSKSLAPTCAFSSPMNMFQTEQAARRRRLSVHVNLLHPDLMHSQWYLCIQFISVVHSDQFTDTQVVPSQCMNRKKCFAQTGLHPVRSDGFIPPVPISGAQAKTMFRTLDIFDLVTLGFPGLRPFSKDTTLEEAVVPLFRSPS